MDLYYFDIVIKRNFVFDFPMYQKISIFIVDNLDEKTHNLIEKCIKYGNIYHDNQNILSKINIYNTIYFYKSDVDFLYYKNSSDFFLKNAKNNDQYIKYKIISCFYSELLINKFGKKIYDNSKEIMNKLLSKYFNDEINDKTVQYIYDNFKKDVTLFLHKLYAHGTNAYTLYLTKDTNFTLLPGNKLKNKFTGEHIIDINKEINLRNNYVSCTNIRHLYIPLAYAFKSSTLWDDKIDGCNFHIFEQVKGLLFNKDNIDTFTKKCKEITEIKNKIYLLNDDEYQRYNILSQIPIVCIGSCINYWDGDIKISEKLNMQHQTTNKKSVCDVAIVKSGKMNEILINELKIELVATNFKDIKIVKSLVPKNIKIIPFELVELFIYLNMMDYLLR